MGLLDYFIKGYDVIKYEYGIDVLKFTYIFIACEFFFNFGIYLMLKGSGFFKIRIRNLLKFKLSDVSVNNKLTLIGFFINRISATIPWAYILIVGTKYLPWPVIIAIIIELGIVFYLGSRVNLAIKNSH